VAPVQKTQKHLATALSPQRTQIMTLLLIPRRCLRRQHHPTRIQTATFFSRPSRASMRNSQHYMRRSLRGQRFSSFRDTVIRAACLCLLVGARSTRRARIKSVAVLPAAPRKRMMANRCGGARLTTERSRRRLLRRGWDCCSLGSSRSTSVYFRS
jgi:hypothetical protein